MNTENRETKNTTKDTTDHKSKRKLKPEIPRCCICQSSEDVGFPSYDPSHEGLICFYCVGAQIAVQASKRRHHLT
ncbi:hypothetical protein BT96DRAFT_912342 [Gymnopus androsaceus JB14]|uniref:Uncharacterized protein n=1 Tax=Gymnopus androsaceus JB14 TaxID=1447944 RepID=A0A6A4IM58_9AGAR|nr:hypothetical protein BT96DRAFT_912342 [Gymnopus androsaceus JB14]